MSIEAIPELSVVYRAVDDLKPNPLNARTHSKHQIRLIAGSIKAFGFTALCRNLEKWPIGGDLKFWPRRLVVEVGLPGCKPESSGDERREMVWKWGRAWCVPARSVVSTPRRRC